MWVWGVWLFNFLDGDRDTAQFFANIPGLYASESPNVKRVGHAFKRLVRIIKERIALAASEEAGRYQLPGLDSDQSVSCIQSMGALGLRRRSSRGSRRTCQSLVVILT